MTVEPGHDPTEWENVPRPTTHSTPAAQPVHYNSARHGSHVEESPELLRWRADLLMDEMMMGGVDLSAADGNRTFSGIDTPVVQRPQSPNHNSVYPVEDGVVDYRVDHGRSPRESYTPDPDQPGESVAGSYMRGSFERGAYERVPIERISPENGAPVQDGYSYRDASGQGSDEQRNGGLSTGEYSNGGHSNVHVEPYEPNGGYVSPPASSHLPGEAPTTDAPHSYPPRSETHVPEIPRDVYRPDVQRPDIQRPEVSSYPYPADEPQRPLQAQPPAHSQPPAYSQSPAQRPAPLPETLRPSGHESSHYEQPGYERPEPRHSLDAGYHFDDQGSQASGREGYASRPYPRPEEPERSTHQPPQQQQEDDPPYQSPLRTTMDVAPVSGSGERTPRSDRLYSVEQQYEQFRREQGSNIQPVEPPRPAMTTRPPLPPIEPPTRQPVTPPRPAPEPVDDHTQWATGADKWEYQDFSVDPNAPQEEPLFSGYSSSGPEWKYGHDSAVRHDPAQFVSAMSVVGTNKKRSTLLPRSTELDIDTLHREISDLHGEIAALLPVGNETSERARHLLDKAYSILQSDPSRSAEVEYYMQQVRTIVQRLHQARQWSDLYRKRLQVYLLGWLGLSGVILLARFLFQTDIELAWMWLWGAPADSWLVTHWATFVGTAFAGAFGGALGALYTMQTHARGEYSFFDRKYGLRGLILPLLGLIVAGLGYLIFGVVFALVGIDPSQSLTAAIVPTTAAFAFGFNQESIYGTRN